MSERELFEQRFPVPAGIYWNDISEQYDALPGAAGFDDVEIYHGQWIGWQAARAQGGQGVEAVAWSWEYRGLHVSTDKAFIEKIAADGFAVRPLVFADTQPAQQDPDLQLIRERDYWEEKATELAEDVGKLLGVEVGEHSSANCPVQNAIDAVFCATEYPAQQGSVPDGFSEFVSAVRSINRSSHHAIQIPGDDQPCFWQRKEWIDWILELADQVEDSLSAATPQPQGDGWIAVPREAVEYLKDQWSGAYARFYEKVDELKRTQPPVEQEGKGDE